jgi:DNA (cytosine-5)-methyltransferase 1
MSQLVLSLFPGVDLLGLAFKREGFCVVQGGDVIFGGDIREEHYPAAKFEGVIGGPPCQAFSRLAHMVRNNGFEPRFGNLIPEFERVVSEARPQWFLMENVVDAPRPRINGYQNHSFNINNRQCADQNGEAATQNRVRAVTFGWRGSYRPLLIETMLWQSQKFEYAATGAGRVSVPIAIGGSGKIKAARAGRNPRTDCLQQRTKRSAEGFREVKRLQGLPDEYDIPGFLIEEKVRAVANGVPLPLGRALAKAVREATDTK